MVAPEKESHGDKLRALAFYGKDLPCILTAVLPLQVSPSPCSSPLAPLEPPISIGKKESLVGQGQVITVTNTSEEHLHEVVVDIKSPAGEAKQLTVPTLTPHESVNIGWLKLDGWPDPRGFSGLGIVQGLSHGGEGDDLGARGSHGLKSVAIRCRPSGTQRPLDMPGTTRVEVGFFTPSGMEEDSPRVLTRGGGCPP